MRHKNNADQSDSKSDSSDNDSTVEVSLRWIHRQIGRVLEIFIILQFVAGSFIFFAGIFLLLWAVIPGTALKAGSYMLLAFYVIGRAILGLVGCYTDNFCLLFSYGTLLVATFVVRTILTLVRLKITNGDDDQLLIPPLLQASPGALSAPIELICSVLEFSQAFCSFYMCYIISKTESIEKSVEESRLNVATEIAKYLTDQEASRRGNEGKATIIVGHSSKEVNEEKAECEKKRTDTSEETESGVKTDLPRPYCPSKQGKGQPVPLKGILHQSSVQAEQYTLSPGKSAEQVDYFAQFRKYPHQVSARPPRPTQLSCQKHSFPEGLLNNESNCQAGPDEEDLDQLVDDFNNNTKNTSNAPMFMTGPGPNFQYSHYPKEALDRREWESAPMYDNEQQPEYTNVSNVTPIERLRAISPTAPSQLNASSPSSPLLYDNRMALYYDYGSTKGANPCQQTPQYHHYPQYPHQQMYR